MHEHPFNVLVQLVLLTVYSCTYMVQPVVALDHSVIPWRGRQCLIN